MLRFVFVTAEFIENKGRVGGKYRKLFTGSDGEIRYGINHGMSRGGSEAVREMRGEINVSKGENIQCSE